MAKKGREALFGDPGFDHNMVPDSGNVNGIWLLRYGGIRQNLATDAGLGKKMIFGIAMTEFRDRHGIPV